MLHRSKNNNLFAGPATGVTTIMLTVLATLVPALSVYAWFFGAGIWVNIMLCMAAALLFEVLSLVVFNKPVKPYVTDGSALVTGVLLALALPPLAPWWVAVTGCFFAIVVAKHLYGGLGHNVFNPAMAGYAVLLISFPREMSLWPSPHAIAETSLNFTQTARWIFTAQLPQAVELDAITAATPLDWMRNQLKQDIPVTQSVQSPLFGVIAGKGMEWVNAAFLLGGLILGWRGIIDWRIPFAFIGTLFLVAAVFHMVNPQVYASAWLHIFSGAAMLGAFYIATDPVTAATTPGGRWLYGAGIGLLTFAIRAWGGFPDGVAFAVLLMGLTVPLLDQYMKPRVFGYGSRHHEP